MRRFQVCSLAALGCLLISGCQAVTNLIPTQTPYPTLTPHPTLTPYPTFTPLPSPTSTPEKKVLFQENDFSGVDSCFPVDSGPDIRRLAADGQYHIVVLESVYYGWSLCDHDLRNFILDVDATVIDGPENNSFAYGVIFRQSKETSGFYNFMITGDGYYSLSGLYPANAPPNDYFSLLNWASIREVNQGRKTNHLRVVALGDQFELYVNGALVGLVREGTLTSGPFGFIVQTFDDPNVEVAFDNLVITEP